MNSQRKTSPAGPAFDISEHLPPIRTETVFGNSKPLALDIGCGDGKFLLELSVRTPHFNHIGVEIKSGRFKKAVNSARRKSVDNLKLIHMDALMAVGVFAAKTFDRIYINFPDPWPKDRHKKHRIINKGFISLLGSVIKPKGTLEIASDHDEYMERATEILEGSAEFQNLTGGSPVVPYPGDRPQTGFEKIFRKQGKTIKYLTYEADGECGGSEN